MHFLAMHLSELHLAMLMHHISTESHVIEPFYFDYNLATKREILEWLPPLERRRFP